MIVILVLHCTVKFYVDATGKKCKSTEINMMRNEAKTSFATREVLDFMSDLREQQSRIPHRPVELLAADFSLLQNSPTACTSSSSSTTTPSLHHRISGHDGARSNNGMCYPVLIPSPLRFQDELSCRPYRTKSCRLHCLNQTDRLIENINTNLLYVDKAYKHMANQCCADHAIALATQCILPVQSMAGLIDQMA